MQIKTPLFLKNPKLFEITTKIINKNGDLYSFDDTIFHLQGGGQPNDRGWIMVGEQKYDIISGNINKETGEYSYKLSQQVNIPLGTQIKMIIDQQLRVQHSKIHSAGHILDLAVWRLKYKWQAGKGYHFLDGPYVQYKGIIQDAQKMMDNLNKEIANIISQQIYSVSKIYSWNEAVELKIIPQTFKVGFVRTMSFGNTTCPCGGTHVGNTSQVEGLVVTKIQKKGKNVRVFYKIN